MLRLWWDQGGQLPILPQGAGGQGSRLRRTQRPGAVEGFLAGEGSGGESGTGRRIGAEMGAVVGGSAGAETGVDSGGESSAAGGCGHSLRQLESWSSAGRPGPRVVYYF